MTMQLSLPMHSLMSWIPYQVLIWLSAAGVLAMAFVQSPAAFIAGHVEGWGYNAYGQASPPLGLTDLAQIDGGNYQTLALRANGTVVAWGANNEGQTTIPQGLNNVVAISAAMHCVALKSDGTVVVWGSNNPAVTNVPPGLSGVAAIAAGDYRGNPSTVAVRSNGTVVAWGWGSNATWVTNVPPGLTGVVQAAIGNGHVVALKNDGSVACWGFNHAGQATPPPGLTGVVAVRARDVSSLALKSDGSIVSWGTSLNVPASLGPVIDVHLGEGHGLALRLDGTVVAWGDDTYGKASVPAGVGGITGIAVGEHFNLVITRWPVIRSISPPAVANAGDTVVFSVTAEGEPLTYQWRRNGVDLPGGTNAMLRLTGVQASDAGTYNVIVRNPHGVRVSVPTSLSFAPPQITSQPQSLTRYRGETATFSVSASGLAPLTYQWLKAGVIIPGQTSTTLTLTNLASSNAGSYRVTVTDAAGSSVTSLAATLSINDPTGTNSSFTFLPVLDTSIFSSGGNPRGVLTILAGTRDNGIRDRGLLRFDLSSLPRSALIQSARLRLTVTGVPRTPPAANFHLHRMLKPWAGDATWASATASVPWAVPGAQPGTDYSSSTSATCLVTLGGAFDFGPSAQLAADIQTWLADPVTNYGWILKAENELLAQSARHFGSSESTQPPQLILRTLASARLTNVVMQPQYFTFTFDAVDGWFHRVQSAATLESGAWTTLTNVPAGPPRTIGVSVPLTHTGRFCRVISE
jgi:alpha-tubulin suppressor-like RCC1 family protein